MELSSGSVIDDRFTLIEELGRGGSGVVWLAADELLLGQHVAIKILYDRYRDNDHALERLEREAKLLAKLDHPNIARPLAVRVRGDGPAYLATELADGKTLGSVMRSRSREGHPFSREEVAGIFEDLCSAIDHAHSKSIIHRDLKPENIMLQERGWRMFVKVLDFGVAKFLEADLASATTLGRRVGTIMYMSPEQTLGAPVTAKSDIFALGIVLFELLTLRRPWAWDERGRARAAHEGPFAPASPQIEEVLRRINSADRPSPSEHRPELGDAIDEVVSTATAIDPDARYATVLDLVRSFRAAWGAPIVEDRTAPVAVQGTEEAIDERSIPIDDERAPLDRTPSGAGSLYRSIDPPADDRVEMLPTAIGGAPFEASDSVATDPQWPDQMKTAYADPPDPTTALTQPSRERPLDRPRRSRLAGLAWAAAGAAIAFGITAITSSNDAPREDEPVDPPAIASPRPTAMEPELAPKSEADLERTKPDVPVKARVKAPANRSALDAPRSKELDPPEPESGPVLAKVDALHARVRSDPNDMQSLIALARAITEAASQIEDRSVREKIIRLASSSADLGDHEGVEEAYRDLVAARGPGALRK